MGLAGAKAHESVATKDERERSKSALLEQWPDLGYLGVGMWWGWIWLCYNSVDALRLFPDEQRGSNVFLMYMFSTLAIAASMLVAAAMWRRATALVDSRGVVVAFGGLASISTLLMGLSGMADSPAMFAVFSALTGVGTSMLCLRAGRAYGALPLGESLTNGALSLILAAALYYVGSGIVPEWRLAYISLLPLAAAGLFSLISDESYPAASVSGTRQATGKERVMFRRLVAASAIVAFTAGFGKGVGAFTVAPVQFAYEGSISVFFIGLIAAVIVFAVNRFNVYQGARVMYSTLMVMGIALMLASCFGFSVSFLAIGKEVLWLVFSCLLAYLAFRFEMSPVRVFGVGQACYFAASTVGWVAGMLVAPSYADATVRMGCGIALAFLVVLVLVYVFPEKSIKQIATWKLSCPVDSAFADDARAQASAEGGNGAAAPGAALHAEGRALAAESGAGACAPGLQVAANASRASCANRALDRESAPINKHGRHMPSAHVEEPNATAAATVAKPAAPDAAQGASAESSKPVPLTERDLIERYGLSKRELEVLELFAQGRSANWIADSLVISKNTVRAHLRAIYSKLDVHTRQDLLTLLNR